MASQGRRINRKRPTKAVAWRPAALFEGTGIMLISLAAFLLLALLSFHSDDPSFNQTGGDAIHNLAGTFGAYLSDVIFQMVGYSAGWLVLLPGIVGIQLLQYGRARQGTKGAQHPAPVAPPSYWSRIAAIPLLMAVTTIVPALFSGETPSLLPAGPGGILGILGADTMRHLFGTFGSLFLLMPFAMLGLMILTRFSLMMHWERFLAWLDQRQHASADVTTPSTTGAQKRTPNPVHTAVAYLLDGLTALAVFLWRLVSALLQKIRALILPPPSPSPAWLEPMAHDPEPDFFPPGQGIHREPSFEAYTDSESPDADLFQTQNREPDMEDAYLDDAPEGARLGEPEGAYRGAPEEGLGEAGGESEDEDEDEDEPRGDAHAQGMTSVPSFDPFQEPEQTVPPSQPPQRSLPEPTTPVDPATARADSVSSPPLQLPVFLWPESPSEPDPSPHTDTQAPSPTEALKNEMLAEETHQHLPTHAKTQGTETGADKKTGHSPEPPVPALEPFEPEISPLPPYSLMVDPGPKRAGGPSREALNVVARTLEQKLGDFKIKGQIIDVLPGPVVTTFELDPAPGLRAAKVIGLADDLARSISASSVRVVGNVPGKTVIGIEIPNAVRQTVYMKEVLSSETFRKTKGPLAVALGSDIFGRPVVGNLAKMPHLLVAGTTGSGKSVAVNAMICSILFNARPDEVRFLMVDPKMLELSIYEGIPHLLAPVVTDVHKAANLLKWAVAEMENRYRLMSELGVRSLAGFNERILKCIQNDEQPTRRVKIGFDPETGQPVEQEEPIPLDTKPLIVIVIDELADLMIQVGKEVEPAIARLAQMARAAGLHLILATQRPSVDVITGLIKANFPTRLAFQVSSKIDSRTILDAMGADRLLGMGDGLFLPPGTSHLQRIHAPFVSDKEVHDLVRFLKTTGTPDYDHSVLVQPAEGEAGEDVGAAGNAGGEAYDELYDKAVGVVIRARKVSTSMVQRHFKIGYNRAARIVERMALDGLISEPNGAGKREVLAPSADE